MYWGAPGTEPVELAFASYSDLALVVPPHVVFGLTEKVCAETTPATQLVLYLFQTLHVPLDGSAPGMVFAGVKGTLVGAFQDFAGVRMTFSQSHIPTMVTITQAA